MNIRTIQLVFLIGISFSFSALAQRGKEKTNALIHTRLELRFDYQKKYVHGKEWLTLRPHLRPTDSLRLDARGMDIHQLVLLKDGQQVPIKYSYNQRTLAMKLDKLYLPAEAYTLYLEYTAKPDELALNNGGIISSDKGLFFINPDSAVSAKPVQIWTQSALHNASVWFPTLDDPNQKTTQEISLTVPGKYETLSNGRLINRQRHADGSRTDTWKMTLPHSPYLFMLAVGNFKVYREQWRGKELSYYLEPAYAPYAKDIFGNTPEMMEFFSKTLGIAYPWDKYAQVVVRDFVSGGMENTSATVLINYVQATARELADRGYDAGRSLIAHELFHQWFGDYVTAKDWSQITLNESFADFGEILWAEYKYGQDAGDAHHYAGLQEYLSDPEAAKKALVRKDYADPQEVFDVVTYQKGGRILHLLRSYLGAPIFYKGLNLYLSANALKNAEVSALQSAMEKASGKKLDWFFEQWYHGAGHPQLDITYQWDQASGTQLVVLKQVQPGKAFILPLAVDVYEKGKKSRRQIVMRSKLDTLRFRTGIKPLLVNVDAVKNLLGEKTDHKELETLLYQYRNAPLYMDRFEAIDLAASRQQEALAQTLLSEALKDKCYGLRLKTLNGLDSATLQANPAVLRLAVQLAETDSNRLVRAAAITLLGRSAAPEQYLPIYQQGLKNTSYAIAAAALKAFAAIRPAEALQQAKAMEQDAGGDLIPALIAVYARSGGDAEWPFVAKKFTEADPHVKFPMLGELVLMLSRLENPGDAQEGIALLKNMAMAFKAQGMAPPLIAALQQIQQARQQKNDLPSAELAEQAIAEIEGK